MNHEVVKLMVIASGAMLLMWLLGIVKIGFDPLSLAIFIPGIPPI